jgi:hypothetical protein
MLKIGDMVEYVSYNTKYPKPIGIVIAHDERYNVVRWMNADLHNQSDGGYFDTSLVVIYTASNNPVDKENSL